MASIDYAARRSQEAACQALADRIVAGIPTLADVHGLPVSRVALAVWIALFCDLVGGEAKGEGADHLIELARQAALNAMAAGTKQKS